MRGVLLRTEVRRQCLPVRLRGKTPADEVRIPATPELVTEHYEEIDMVEDGEAEFEIEESVGLGITHSMRFGEAEFAKVIYKVSVRSSIRALYSESQGDNAAMMLNGMVRDRARLHLKEAIGRMEYDVEHTLYPELFK